MRQSGHTYFVILAAGRRACVTYAGRSLPDERRGPSDMSNGRLDDRLAHELRHLPTGAERHFHIAVNTDDENEWDFARFMISPPYRQRTLAEADASDPSLIAKAGSFDIDILECDRTCPHSSLGRFGWETDEHVSRRWWEGFRSPGDYQQGQRK